jgi:hypothetical protein
MGGEVKMKRIIISLLVIILGFGIVGFSVWREQSVFVTHAVVDEIEEEEPIETTVSAEENLEEDEYSLVYPGVLPDHPLYFLKMIRDRIQLWMTRDLVKQAELQLHYADKRAAASLALAEKGKLGLAVSTASKAEKYLEQALGKAKEAQESGKEVEDFYRTLMKATGKHKKVLAGVRSRLPEETSQTLDDSVTICQRVYDEAVLVVGEEMDLETGIDEESEEIEETEEADEVEEE